MLPSVLGTSPNSKSPGSKRAGVRAPDSRLASDIVQPRDTHRILPHDRRTRVPWQVNDQRIAKVHDYSKEQVKLIITQLCKPGIQRRAPMTETLAQISRLVREAAETHHRVFRIVDGADDDWASWYGDWLINLSELPRAAGSQACPQ